MSKNNENKSAASALSASAGYASFLPGLPVELQSNPKDKVYTPCWAASDIVQYFRPCGKLLEPCKGGGAFLQYMGDADWCEIDEGRDFFACAGRYDWLISNPPFSILHSWLEHSFKLAENVVYLIPLWKYFGSHKTMRMGAEYGGIKEIRIYGTGGTLGFPLGNTVGAMHWKRGYHGQTRFSWFSDSQHNAKAEARHE